MNKIALQQIIVSSLVQQRIQLDLTPSHQSAIPAAQVQPSEIEPGVQRKKRMHQPETLNAGRKAYGINLLKCAYHRTEEKILALEPEKYWLISFKSRRSAACFGITNAYSLSPAHVTRGLTPPPDLLVTCTTVR